MGNCSGLLGIRRGPQLQVPPVVSPCTKSRLQVYSTGQFDRRVDGWRIGQTKRRLETDDAPPPPPKRRRTGLGPPHPQVEENIGCQKMLTKDTTVEEVEESEDSGNSSGSLGSGNDGSSCSRCRPYLGIRRGPQLHVPPVVSPCTKSRLQVYSTADFIALYENLKPLGAGGYGTVYSAIRKEDNLHVAIKFIPMAEVVMLPINLRDRQICLPLEVALLLQAAGAPGAEHPGAVVCLLDWFQLDQYLVLVQERPDPIINLCNYADSKGGFL